MSTRTRPAPDQLPLELGSPADPADATDPATGARPPGWLASMLPGTGAGPFDDDFWFFEPWWPGVPATAVVDGPRVSLVANQLSDPMPAFPELRSMPRQVRGGAAVMPGTLVVLDADGRPDIDALHRRLADPDDRPGMGAFIAADLLERDGHPLTDRGFGSRRAALLDAVLDGDRFLVSRGLRGEGHTLAAAAASMGITGISARRLDAPWRSGVAPEAWLRLAVDSGSVGPMRPLLVLLQRLPLD